jgi:hypothetical protein
MGCKVAVGMGVIVGAGVFVRLGVFMMVSVDDGITSTGGPINSAVLPTVFGLANWARFEQADIEKIKIRITNDKVKLYFCLNKVFFI